MYHRCAGCNYGGVAVHRSSAFAVRGFARIAGVPRTEAITPLEAGFKLERVISAAGCA